MNDARRILLSTALLALSAGAIGAQAQAQTPAPTGPKISVGALSYFQYGYQLAAYDTANKNNNAFEVTRAYINVIASLPGGLMARVTPDIYRTGAANVPTIGAGTSPLNFRLKYAYVGYNPSAGPLTWKFGLTQTPLLDWEEALWDFRMQGPMALDRNGYVTSSDLGAAVDGNINSEAVDFQAGFFNGEGYGNTSGDKRKDVMGRVSVRVLATDDASRIGGLRITGYAQYGKPTGGGTRQRYLGMVSYRSTKALLVGEYTSTQDSAGVNPKKSGKVVSAYGWYAFTPKARIMARWDDVDPTAAANDKASEVIAGVSYQVTPNFRVLADYDGVTQQTAPIPAQNNKTQSAALVQLQFNF